VHQYGQLEVVKELVKAGGEALLIKTAARGGTCLHTASFMGKPPVVHYLAGLLGGRMLRQTSSAGTALDCAVEGGHAGVRDWLLSAGARPGSFAERRRP
jgi:hypothetical protein